MDETPGSALHWKPARRPARAPLEGALVRLEPVDPARHLADLYAAAGDPAIWRYLPTGPYPDEAPFAVLLESHAASEDPLFFTIVDLRDGRPAGIARLR